MNRRSFVRSAALLPLAAGGVGSSLASQLQPDPLPKFDKAEPDTRQDAAPDTARPMHARYELTLQRVLSGQMPAYSEGFILDDVRPTAGRRFTEYSGDVSGRYIGALATASRVYGTTFPGLDPLVTKVIALQKPDGYFGSTFHYDKPTDQDLALLWGNGRLLVGLTEYYRLKPSLAVLAACDGIGNFLVRIAPLMLSKEIREQFGAQHFASSYICWTQQTEGLANLYELTRDERYSKLAAEIFAVTERRPADHVHGYLSSVRGAMDLYRVTSNAAILARCEAAWTDVAQSKDSLITGGVPEGWSPNNSRTEGCGEVDWLRLNLMLWKATGNAKYLAMAEKATFNEVAFNQYASGDFGHHVYTETGLPAGGAVRAWWCCTLHGLRVFPDLQGSAFTFREGKLSYDLPIDAQYKSEALSLTAKSSLAHDGHILITAAGMTISPVPLSIRLPEWANSLVVHVNNDLLSAPIEGGYVNTGWTPRPGDVLHIQYKMSLRTETAGKGRVSYWYGPWLLGAPAVDNPAYFNEMTEQNRLSAIVDRPAGASTSRFAVPVAAQVFGYIPAEFPEQPSQVVLRPIAEQAGMPTTSWELRFLTRA